MLHMHVHGVGIARYPAVHWPRNDDGKCSEFDGTQQPWYTAAVAGSRNIVVLIDSSGSMSSKVCNDSPETETRLALAKQVPTQ